MACGPEVPFFANEINEAFDEVDLDIERALDSDRTVLQVQHLSHDRST